MALADTGQISAPAPPTSASARLESRLGGFAVRVYWLWPALLMFACAAYRLGTPSLWADELATWGAVRMGWGPLFRLLGHVDAVVGPYYATVKVWTSVAGTSTVALRMPSVFAMAASAALVTVLGTRLFQRWIGLLAGLIFALTPTTSRFAQEARPYAFAILFATAATLLLVRFLERPTTGTGLGYAVCVALLAAFHIVGLLLLLAHAVAARRRLAAWAAWAGLGVLPALPLAWFGYRQRGQVAWIPLAKWHIILGSPDVLFVSSSVGGAMIVLGLLAMSRRPGVPALAAWALVPVAVLAAVGQFAPLFYARYLLFVVPAWVLLAALALERLPRWYALAVVLALTLLGAPTQNTIRNPDGHPTASATAGSIIAVNERPGDGVAYKMPETAPWEGRDVVARYVPAAKQPRDVFAVVPQRVNGYLGATECTDLRACLDQADPPRMWVIRKNSTPDPLSGIGEAKENLLRGRYHLIRLWLVKGMTIGLYARN